MRLAVLCTCILFITCVSGCASIMGASPPLGVLVSSVRGSGGVNHVQLSKDARPGRQTGKACAFGVLGLFAWGDMSLDAAKKAGGIDRVDTIDYESLSILGVVYARNCLVITGGRGSISSPKLPTTATTRNTSKANGSPASAVITAGKGLYDLDAKSVLKIRQLIGRRVTMGLDNGRKVSGKLTAVGEKALTIERTGGIGTGVVEYPWSSLQWIR